MFDRNSAVELLRDLPWEEGLKHRIIEGPYRHSLEIVCSSHGRKKAVFADGKEHGYFSYMRISSTGIGAHVVPVLPDGRLLMVVEQRPPQDYPGESRQLPMVNGRPLSLDKYGPYSSLEFPG